MTLPGNPTALAERASSYTASAKRIDRAADDLRSLAYTSTAKSLDAIRERSAEVAGDHDDPYGRYAGPAAALGGSAGAPARSVPPGRPSNSAGRVDMARISAISDNSPLCTSRRPAGSMVSSPMAPASASAKGSRLVSTSCGL